MKFLDRILGAVETDRLLLRRWRQKDLGDFIRQVADEEVMLAAGAKPAADEKEARQRFKRAVKEGQYAITLRETGEVIGYFQFARDLTRRNVTSFVIGYWLEKPHWGKGYMTEALRAMTAYGFEKRDAEVLAIGHEVGNEGSRRVIEKCGFTYEGTRRKAFRRCDGALFDDECYSMLREEFFGE